LVNFFVTAAAMSRKETRASLNHFEDYNKYPAKHFAGLFDLFCYLAGENGDGCDMAGHHIDTKCLPGDEQALEEFSLSVAMYTVGLEKFLKQQAEKLPEGHLQRPSAEEIEKVVVAHVGRGPTEELHFNGFLTLLEVGAQSKLCFCAWVWV